MAEDTSKGQGPSSHKYNSFSKGMIKDIVDIYTPESVWKNAVNAINNTHNGDVGSIGNEQANTFCAQVPYTVIGIIHKFKTEWVVFSTNNTDSEIGIFDDAICTYKTIINDSCLNFSTFNLITGAAKENYDCTYSVYWQDNLNPDRVLNLDRVPYICTEKTVTTSKVYKEYTITRDLAPDTILCGSSTAASGLNEDSELIHQLGETLGVVTIDFCTYGIPDKIEAFFDGVLVASYNDTTAPGYPDSPPGVCPTCDCRPGIGGNALKLTFNKFTSTPYVTVKVTRGSAPGTNWAYKVNCPVPDTNTPPATISKTNIFYTDIYDNIVEVPILDYGMSIKIQALEDSIISTDSVGYTISAAGAIVLTKTSTGPDPDACGEKDCTDRLDCDALRLHPLVQQPCITISKSKGSGQLNNGSYQAVIAYSENGIKLTDYSMPSNAQGLWDHTGMGGSLNIDITKLDQNFQEYELVVIAVVNQQTIAKKIGNYSIDQAHVHLDLFLQSLPTIDLNVIPMRTVIYEKSEKMFDINGYLLRTSVTSQPFFNYQPLANQIKAEWQVAEYPADYYWQGGNNVGNMRDEVYPYFIRWVYNTGARSASFHIPGRAALTTDREIMPITDDVLNSDRREKWQVYDTSTITTVSNPLFTADGGIIKARGDMAYWESSEKYPNNHREIWGDLCFKPIRHHKMPSNETAHIHDSKGEKIYVLGVSFYNIKHPVDTNGNKITDIVGYEILRGSREGNRSILAKGLFNNMIQYDVRGNPNVKGLFQNYPYNDIEDDPFLDPVYHDGEDKGEPTGVNNLIVKQNILSFHSPENNLVKPYVGSGAHIKLYTEETGTAEIRGEIPYKHPQFKFIHEQLFTAGSLIALGIGLLALFGKTTTTTSSTGHFTGPGGEVWAGAFATGGGTVVRFPTINYDTTTTATNESGPSNIIPAILSDSVLSASSAATASIPGIAYYLGKAFTLITSIVNATYTFYAAFDQVINIMYNIINYRNYVIQLNSHGFYNSFAAINNTTIPTGTKGSYTRAVENTKLRYVSSGLQDFDGSYRINNVDRNKYLALKLDKDLPYTSVKDESKSLLNKTDEPFHTFERNIASYYGAIKYDYENQYGQLQAIVQLPTSSCVYDTISPLGIYYTPVIFGGDTYINRYTEKNPYYFFHTWLFDVPNGTEFDYQDYENGPEPTYWINSKRYDASLFNISVHADIDLNLKNPKFDVGLDFNTPSDYHWLDERQKKDTGGPIVHSSFKYAWMYLSNNSVRDFFVESELNIAFRDYGEEPWQKFYDPVGNSFSDLSTMFRSDLIKRPIYYEYDLSLSASKLYSNFKSWGNILPRDYDPLIYTSCFQYYPKRIIYSLQQQSGLKRDMWRNFLRFNYKDWNDKVNSIKNLNAYGAIILFENSEPMQFVGVDSMKTAAGVKYTVGDAELFMQNMQSVVNADDAFAYGSSISHRAAVNTPYGLFWISQKTGKVCVFGGQSMDEISNQGMKHWFLENLPSPLLAVYPDFPLYDNVIEGISCQAIFDSQYELIYFTKKDYKPRPEFDAIKNKLTYVNGKGFYLDGNPPVKIDIRDYMYEYTWTLSYDPKIKAWISFHNWYPSFLIPSYNHFLTIKGNTFWRHNTTVTDYCRYYDIQYPWEVEYPIVTPSEITTLRSVEYIMQGQVYYNDGKDYNHVLDANFDRAIIYNSEQVSGILKLNLKDKKNPVDMLRYPIIGTNRIDILYSKEENKFRFNQFYDITRDRGEFTGNTVNMWDTQLDGFTKFINPNYVDYIKEPMEHTNVPSPVPPLAPSFAGHKKFRHYGNFIILRKNQSGNLKMILKLTYSKHLNSPR